MKIGLLGFGVVGRGVYELTRGRDDMQVVKVLRREDMQLPDAKTVRDIRDIVEDDSIDTVVEVMGGLHPAYDYVRAAIEAGKNVVTANKALVCTFYDELLPLVREKGVLFRCTAAVGGGIGWLSELERARRVQSIREVGGIMNGTCNYILDNMTRQGLNYDDVLKQAQTLGYAEADPSTDVDGIDTWHKAILSANIAFGVSLDKGTVPVAGIRNIKAEDVENFKAHGLVCKLIATGKRDNGVISAYVQPTLVKDGEPEAAVPMNYNLITFVGETSQRMSFFGQGAGRYPTAYNVVPGSGGRSCREGLLRPLRRPCGGCERREADMVRSRQLERRDKGALGQRGGDRAGIRCRNARMAERESQRIRRGNSRMTESDREEQKMKVVKFGGSSMADARPVPQGTGYPSGRPGAPGRGGLRRGQAVRQ